MVVLVLFYDKERSQYFERPIVNKELQFWKNALTALERGEECMVLVVVESIGSSPGRAGFKALVSSAGELHGSIGGGSMEHKLVELARSQLKTAGSLRASEEPAEVWESAGSSARDPAEVLQLSGSTENDPFLMRQIHRANEPTDRSGMICSGEQTIGFYLLKLSHQPLIKKLAEKIATGINGTLRFDHNEISLLTEPIKPGRAFLQPSATEWTYIEPLVTRPRIMILGAGHVGLALSRTMHQLGFHVHLMDDRAELNTMAQNQWAHISSVVDYASIGDVIHSDPELFVVLVSFGYRTDDLLVRQLIRKPFKYLGMMGSEAKIKTLFVGLRKDGFTAEEIGRVRAPIGLAIGSRTPEEIAISIAAEIISVRNMASNPL
ncbi:MAG: XdhC family protein [Flavobacteriales bacterium]|nr:XdhC family protein [Flavobacteriales bacterium]MBK6943370.1 XdhC family protein [Flavobacteriales bacterium]MBK7240750.1 XdhC family protein [Flavobacteriales bacterium]MBK9536097.1 XdhC family protein [Flavobacteriales bacterium]